MKCTKCKKEFDPSKGCYNYPSGVKCPQCGGKRDATTPEDLAKLFVKKMAAMPLGHAPSVGYMDLLIGEAKAVSKTFK